MISISTPVLQNELETAQAIINKWQKQLEVGLPGIDLPGDADTLQSLLLTFIGELRLVAGKCDTMADVLHHTTL